MAECTYTLYFGAMRIGKVREREEDFPNLRGEFVLDEGVNSQASLEAKRMLDFIALNRESMRLVDVMHEEDVDAELAAVNQQLEPYSDLAESEDWYLVRPNGSRVTILCPLFRDGGQIVWRWAV